MDVLPVIRPERHRETASVREADFGGGIGESALPASNFEIPVTQPIRNRSILLSTQNSAVGDYSSDSRIGVLKMAKALLECDFS